MIASWTADMWSPVINLFSFIPSYGFMIIVFTICLKLVLSPLDFWQKKVSRSSMLKQQKLQPELIKLQKKFGNNKQMLNQKTMELYKKENYNVMGSCFSMLLNMGLTLFIFFTLFTGLIGISQDKTYNQYLEIEKSYTTTFNQQMKDTYTLSTDTEIQEKLQALIAEKNILAKNKLIEEGIETPTTEQISQKAKEMLFAEKDTEFALIVTNSQKEAAKRYEEIKDNWLWVDNIWRPDTHVAGYPGYNDFVNMSDLKNRFKDNPDRISEIEQNFDIITANIQKEYSSWNGYFILVILAGLITCLSMFISQMTNSKKKKQQNITNINGPLQQGNGRVEKNQQNTMNGATKIMAIVMPIIMVIFTISYSATFAMYIVTNSLMGTIISFISLKIIEKMDKNKEQKEKAKKKVEYSR